MSGTDRAKIIVLLIIILVMAIYGFKSGKALEKRCTGKVFGKVTDVTVSGSGKNRKVHVTYEYYVDNERYSDSVSMGRSSSGYYEGKDCIIHYNPDDPSENFIGSVSPQSNKAIILIFCFIGLAAIFGYSIWKKIKENNY